MKLKERAKKLKTDIPAIFLALKDKDTPVIAKIFAGCTVAYALSPIDLIPDFIPVLGYLDDIILLPALAALTIKLIPEDIMERNRKLSDGIWKNGKPKKWYYAVPIIAFWILIVLLIIKAVINK
ncbi:MAG: YkvA family protein [Oscillospiraceae bacterium]